MKALIIAALLAVASPLHAQTGSTAFEVQGHVVAANSNRFDANDFGVGARFGWQASHLLGLEAELNTFPRSFPDERGFSGSRTEGLFGVTAGPRLGAVRVFAKARPGFLRYSEPDQPIACIAIFPPPLSCVLSAGRTLFAFDLGGGIAIAAGGNGFIRIDAGDRLVRYPGVVLDPGFVVRDEPYFGHDFRFSAGGGIRF